MLTRTPLFKAADENLTHYPITGYVVSITKIISPFFGDSNNFLIFLLEKKSSKKLLVVSGF